MATFTLKRDKYSTTTTLGKWYKPDGSFFQNSLEPAVRAIGVKVTEKVGNKIRGRTAIKGGTIDCPERYLLTNKDSKRFKKILPIISNTDEYWKIKYDGIEFLGVRVHGMNDFEDTDACIGCSKNRYEDTFKIQGNKTSELIALIDSFEKNGETVYLDIINLPQNGS